MNEYTAIKTSSGFIAYGPFGSTMRTNSDKDVTYSNMVEESTAYKNLINAIKAI